MFVGVITYDAFACMIYMQFNFHFEYMYIEVELDAMRYYNFSMIKLLSFSVRTSESLSCSIFQIESLLREMSYEVGEQQPYIEVQRLFIEGDQTPYTIPFLVASTE